MLSVAVHEAGHACTAHLFGDLEPRVRIEAIGDGFKGWCRTKLITDPRQYRSHVLAGIVAQTLHRIPNVDAATLFDMLKSDRLTMTIGDELAAGDFTLDDIRATIALVRRLWPQIERTATLLVQHTIDRLPRR